MKITNINRNTIHQNAKSIYATVRLDLPADADAETIIDIMENVECNFFVNDEDPIDSQIIRIGYNDLPN